MNHRMRINNANSQRINLSRFSHTGLTSITCKLKVIFFNFIHSLGFNYLVITTNKLNLPKIIKNCKASDVCAWEERERWWLFCCCALLTVGVNLLHFPLNPHLARKTFKVYYRFSSKQNRKTVLLSSLTLLKLLWYKDSSNCKLSVQTHKLKCSVGSK